MMSYGHYTGFLKHPQPHRSRLIRINVSILVGIAGRKMHLKCLQPALDLLLNCVFIIAESVAYIPHCTFAVAAVAYSITAFVHFGILRAVGLFALSVEVYCSCSGVGYVFADLADDIKSTNRQSDYWTATDSGTAIYHSSDNATVAGYSLENNNTTIKYNATTDGVSLLTLSGLKDNIESKVNSRVYADDTFNGVTFESSTVSIASNIIGTSGVTVTGSSSYNKYELGGKAQLTYSGTTVASLVGSTGNDSITNSSGASVTIDGGAGNDVIVAGGNGDNIYAGAGNDSITLGNGKDTVTYGAGKVVISGFTSADTFKMDSDVTISKSSWTADTGLVLTTNNGTVTFNQLGSDTGVTVGTDVYAGEFVYNTAMTSLSVNAGFTGDEIDISSNTTVKEINAESSKQGLTITGNDSGNTITGSGKADIIYTGSGTNSVDGGKGNDTIYASAGTSTLTGGDGKDVFVIGSNGNTIADYAKGDKINIDGGEVTNVATISGGYVITFSPVSGGDDVKVTVNTSEEKININDEDRAFGNNIFYNAKKTAATLLSSFSAATFTADSSVVSIDAKEAMARTMLLLQARKDQP